MISQLNIFRAWTCLIEIITINLSLNIVCSSIFVIVFVERVLRLQPKVRRLYLLVRASDNKAAKQRLHSEVYLHTFDQTFSLNNHTSLNVRVWLLRKQVFEKDLFRVLRKNVGDERLNALISEKVVPIPGDISLNIMGVIRDSNFLQDMMQEIDIIVNSAATTRFDERYYIYLICKENDITYISCYCLINWENRIKNLKKPRKTLKFFHWHF